MQLLGGQDGEILAQIKPRLGAKYGIRAGTGAVGLEFSVVKDVPQQIEVLNHSGINLTTKHTLEKEFEADNCLRAKLNFWPAPALQFNFFSCVMFR